MQSLNRFLASSVVFGALLATGCQQKSSGPRNEAKALPKALSPYRGGDLPPPGEVPKTRVERTAEMVKFDDADGLEIELKNACAIEVCGPVFMSDQANQTQKDDANVAKVEAQYKADFALVLPTIESIIRKDAEVTQLGIKKLDEAKSQLQAVNLGSQYRILINLFWASSHLGEIYGEWGGQKFNEASAKSALEGKVPAAEMDDLLKMSSTLLLLPHFQNSIAIEALGLDAFFESLAKSSDAESKKKAAKTWATQLLKQANEVRSTFPLFFTESIEALEALSLGKDLSGRQADKLSEEVGIAMLHPILHESSEIFSKRKFDFTAMVNEYFANSRAKLLEESSAENQALRLSRAKLTCGSTVFGFAALQRYEEEGLSSAPKLIELVRTSVSKTVPDFTENSMVAAAIQDNVKAVHFQVPDRLKVAFGKLQNSLNEKVKDSDESLKYIQQGKTEDLAIMVAAAVFKDKDEDDDLLQECSSQDPTRYNDNSKSGYGFIQISWRTILQPETGFGVIAHEFGHEISSQLRAADSSATSSIYDKILSCLVERKADSSQSTKEEDFADAFAAKTIRRYRAENPNAPALGNFACALMNRDENRWGTNSGLSLQYPKGYKDSHSTHFYRAIQYKLDTEGKVSDACSQVISKGKPSMTKTCTAL